MNTKLFIAAGALALLSGCASMGESNYSCDGLDGEPQEGCMSVREAYQATNQMNDTNQTLPSEVAILNAQHVANNYVSPRLPHEPVPVRTPAEVMRIWVAPWESDSGDLMVTGHVFTEIEPRRWTLGSQPGGSSDKSLNPLAD